MTDQQYAPQSLDECVFGNDESRALIEDITNGALLFPLGGKTGILLYGTFGTGKTTLARMLPALIEKGLTGEEPASEAEFFGCQQGHMGSVFTSAVAKQSGVVSFNASGNHYFIFDEVDSLSKAAQAGLKTTLNTPRSIYILTTNNISQLDKGVKDRCVLVEMNAAKDVEFLPLARRIATDESVVLNDAQLLGAIAANNGSFRGVIFNVLRLCRRTAWQQRTAANIASNAIQQASKGVNN